MKIEFDETVHKCPCCGGKKQLLFWMGQDTLYGTALEYVACPVCGVRYLKERMSEEAIRKFYGEAYRSEYVKSLTGYSEEWDTRRQNARYELMLKALKQAKPDFVPSTCMDIGCDTGLFAKAIQKEWKDCRCYGMEWNEEHSLIALRQGVYTVNSWEAVSTIRFDLVTLSHVLEHMNDPLKELKKIIKGMAKGGILIIEVPNAETYQSAYAPVHPIAFTNEALQALITKAGFKVVTAFTHPGLMQFPIGYYLGVIAEKEE